MYVYSVCYIWGVPDRRVHGVLQGEVGPPGRDQGTTTATATTTTTTATNDHTNKHTQW